MADSKIDSLSGSNLLVELEETQELIKNNNLNEDTLTKVIYNNF